MSGGRLMNLVRLGRSIVRPQRSPILFRDRGPELAIFSQIARICKYRIKKLVAVA